MRHYVLLLLAGFVISLTSCRNDFEFEQNTGGLEFSRDTVYLDTVFANIGSSTYTLKVYNRSDKDISIPSLKLKKGEESRYRLMVDGQAGKVFSNVELMAKDSLFVLIETTAGINDVNPADFLYTDEIEFSGSNGIQEVNLVTLIQDAVFLFPQRDDAGNVETVPLNEGEPDQIYGFNLNQFENGNELNFTAAKPYVIYGYATVPGGQTLNIDAGARVHFHADSGLMVRPGATLKVNGTPSSEGELTNEVIFEGDRLEPDFAETPGQWGTIWLREGSTAHNLNNLTLKNATVGILMEGNDGTESALTLNNVQIYNCANVGILSRAGSIDGQNVVINNAGQASLGLTLGGFYNFRYCTFANYSGSFNQVPLLMNDYQQTADAVLINNLQARFDNCIFYGSGNYGISLENVAVDQPGVTFNYLFNHCLIKFTDFSNTLAGNVPYVFEDTNHYNQCIIARSTTADTPEFEDPAQDKFGISNESAANGTADQAFILPFDVANRARTAPYDIGAYESTAAE